MSKLCLNPPSLFSSVAHGFSQVVVASGARMVFISGQTAWDSTKRIVGRNLQEQAVQAFRNLEAAVETAGGRLTDVVALRIYIVGNAERDLAAVGNALKVWFPTDPPATTWIGVTFLAVPEFLIEVEAVAVLD